MVKVIGTQLSMLARHGKFLRNLLCTQSLTCIYQFVCNYCGFPSRYFFSTILQGQSAKDLVSPDCPAGHPFYGEGQFACKAYCKGACATGSLKSDFHLKYVKNIGFFRLFVSRCATIYARDINAVKLVFVQRRMRP